MKSKPVKIFTTTDNLENCKLLIDLLLSKKLIACANYSEVLSSYTWNEVTQKDQKEYEISMKTTLNLLDEVTETIKNNHNYKVPQIYAIEIAHADSEYIAWMISTLKNTA